MSTRIGGGVVQERRLAKDGKYDIRIHVDGAWKTITVDDRIPCLRKNEEEEESGSGSDSRSGGGTDEKKEEEMSATAPPAAATTTEELIPAFGRSSTKNELWVSLLEKAIAKHYGSYEAITGEFFVLFFFCFLLFVVCFLLFVVCCLFLL